MAVGSSTSIRSNVGKPGDLGIEARFDGRNPLPIVRVWTSFPGAKPYSRDLSFYVEESPYKVVKRLGPTFQRDLDYWMINIRVE